ncbi:MAG: TrmB family transcriptional regulator [Anaerolineae bacterium]
MSLIEPDCVDRLVAIGLSKYEALAYLALLEENNTTALNVSDRAGIPRQRIYDVLGSLQTKGACTVREGRPRCYAARRPQQALAAILDYRRQQQARENERQARLIQELIPVLNTRLNGDDGTLPSKPAETGQVKVRRDIGGF